MLFKPAFTNDYYDYSRDVLETALSQVLAYQAWQKCDPGPECPIDARYAAMPVLTKKDIRKNYARGLSPSSRDTSLGLAGGEIEYVRTSGTVDDSIVNIWNQKWWDASEKASWKLNANASRIATGSHHEAILANPLNVGLASETELPFEKRRLARFLYLNEKADPLSWSPDYMDRMIKELDIFRPAILEANPSLLAKLCRYAASSGKKVFQPGLIVFTYEYPANFHYQQIRRVFNSPVASSYGTTETGYVFMQCEEGKLHQNSEFCRVDFQPLKPEHGGPFLGRILVTTFNNPWYYIIRYDVGDLVRLDEQGPCPCGRNSGLILSAIEGRVANATLTCSGRLVTLRELDNALAVLEGIDEYRLEQPREHVYQLYLVSQRPDRSKLTGQAQEILKGLYGREAAVTVIYEDAVSPASSGKYCLSRTSLPLEIERYLDRSYTAEGGT